MKKKRAKTREKTRENSRETQPGNIKYSYSNNELYSFLYF